MVAERDNSRSPRGNGLYHTEEDIMRLVVQREQARLQKDWESADAFRDRLSAAGVQLFDKTNTWKANDGRSGRIPTFDQVEAGAGDPNAVIAAMDERANGGFSYPVYNPDSEEGQIKQLVTDREQARAAKDFARSDQLRDELKALGVEVFDKEKMWKSKNGLSGIVVGYRASGTGGVPTDVEITTLVQQREKARHASDWETADMIRDELKQWGVDIFDKDKVWRCSDGRNGPVPPWSAVSGAVQHMGAPAPAMHHPPGISVHNLNQLLSACAANAQNPATSARTIALLQQAAMPVVGGPAPTGYGVPPPAHLGYGAPPYAHASHGTPPPPSRSMSTGAATSRRDHKSMELKDALKFCRDSQASQRYVGDDDIIWLVQVREKLRRDKDYPGADNLRQAMRSSLGLELHEKDKTWAMSDGRTGEIPQWSTLA